MMSTDNHHKADPRLEKLLSLYEVDEPSADLEERILQKAAAYPRAEEPGIMSILKDIALAPLDLFIFKRDYLPLTFALMMFVVMIFVNDARPPQVPQGDIQNYASVMGDINGDMTDITDRSTGQEQANGSFDHWSYDMQDMMMQDLEERFATEQL